MATVDAKQQPSGPHTHRGSRPLRPRHSSGKGSFLSFLPEAKLGRPPRPTGVSCLGQRGQHRGGVPASPAQRGPSYARHRKSGHLRLHDGPPSRSPPQGPRPLHPRWCVRCFSSASPPQARSHEGADPKREALSAWGVGEGSTLKTLRKANATLSQQKVRSNIPEGSGQPGVGDRPVAIPSCSSKPGLPPRGKGIPRSPGSFHQRGHTGPTPWPWGPGPGSTPRGWLPRCPPSPDGTGLQQVSG